MKSLYIHFGFNHVQILFIKLLNIFAAGGLDKSERSILSEEFLAKIQDMPHRNLAIELLQKLLKGEIRILIRKNVVKTRAFFEMLEKTLRRYQNRSIDTVQVIKNSLILPGISEKQMNAEKH